MKCQQPTTYDQLRVCSQPSYGTISPGALWSEACFYHFNRAVKKGWLGERGHK